MTSVYLFDTGSFQPLPGIAEDFRYSLLPFWGNYCLVDFMVANFWRGNGGDARGNGAGRDSVPRETELTIVLEESPRTVPIAFSSRWKKPVGRVVGMEDPVSELIPLLSASPSENVIIGSLSSVCVLDTAALLALAAGSSGRIIKVSVARTPIEMYAMGKETIVSLLKSVLQRRTDRKPLRESLFTGALLASMDLIEEVPGEILFQNDLMEYYHRNLWVIGNAASPGYLKTIARLPELSEKGAESHIAEKGLARNSWLASGVEVEGEVEDSILFPNVHIRKNARVSRSIVMNGNRVGAGGDLQNALVLPFSTDISRTTANIGDNCSIGSRSSTARNVDFPDQIRDGLTVIGMNSEIPAGLRLEAGVCIGPGVTTSMLRKMKLVKKGTSVFKPRSPEAEPREEAEKGRR